MDVKDSKIAFLQERAMKFDLGFWTLYHKIHPHYKAYDEPSQLIDEIRLLWEQIKSGISNLNTILPTDKSERERETNPF